MSLLQHRKILDAFSDYVYIISPDYEIEYMNSAIEKKVGKARLINKLSCLIFFSFASMTANEAAGTSKVLLNVNKCSGDICF